MGKKLFKKIPSKVGDLVRSVRNGRIGFLDLQRPFIWKETSDKVNAFAAGSRIPAVSASYNTLLAVEPSRLIRIAVEVGFRRTRFKYAYMLLCGKNLETGKFSDKVQHDALQIFKAALDKVINLNNWRRFMIIVGEAAYMDFLRIRRVLMAQIVYKACKRLCK